MCMGVCTGWLAQQKRQPWCPFTSGNGATELGLVDQHNHISIGINL